MVGRPKTGGRKKGVPNKATAKREKEIAKSGMTPLEYMLKVMRNPRASHDRRDDMAKAVAPYVHPKLASLQHTGAGGGPIQTVALDRLKGMDDKELEVLERALIQIGLVDGNTGGASEPEE